MEPESPVQESGTTQPPPESVTSSVQSFGEASKGLIERILSRPHAPEVCDEELERREKMRENARRANDAYELIEVVGSRYENCTVASFDLSGTDAVVKAKREAVERVKAFGKALREQVDAGANLFIYGPPGTGKDHLMVALMLHAIRSHGIRVKWCNGQTLFGDFRDNIDRDVSERALLSKYTSPEVLAISDPVPPKGEISAYASGMLYRIVDERYRRNKPTWVTVNVSKSDDAVKELSGPIYDRLVDGALRVFCNWPSHRQARKQ